MKTALSGTRDGVPWPPAGDSVDLPDEEAAHLVAAGLAVELDGDDETPAEESATPPDTAEKAVPGRRRGPATKPGK
jgi:hypothetical protein